VADFVFPGSQIQTGKESRVLITLFFDSCYRLEVGENSLMLVTDRERQIKQGAILKEETIEHCYRPGQMSVEMGTVPGGTVIRAEGVPVIKGLFPSNNTVIIDLYPEFRWKSISEKANYRLTLYRSTPDNKDGDMIWQIRVSENHLVYPKSPLPLERGHLYEWKVETLEGEMVTEEGIGIFQVLDEESMVRVKEVQKSYLQEFGPSEDSAQALSATKGLEDPSSHLLLALFYESLGAWGEALSEYNRVGQRFPDSPSLHRSIAFLYETLGLDEEAQKTWAVVDRLEKERKNE
jgi:hypothetical protein